MSDDPQWVKELTKLGAMPRQRGEREMKPPNERFEGDRLSRGPSSSEQQGVFTDANAAELDAIEDEMRRKEKPQPSATAELLHVLRNPWGYDVETIHHVRLETGDLIERLERDLADAIERERMANMRADQAEEARGAAEEIANCEILWANYWKDKASAVSASEATAWIATGPSGRVLHLSNVDGWKVEVVATDMKAAHSATENGDTAKLYNELLYAVGNKHLGETRHQTAKRYIMRAEQSSDARASQSRSPSE